MTALFADTFYYLALLNRDDAAHDSAREFARTLTGSKVTTAWVLTEIGDALAKPKQRGLFVGLLKRLRSDPTLTIIAASDELFGRGFDLYASRPDKGWSLTDCISFVVMREHGLTEALTADRHFSQAGFRALLT